MRIQFINKGFQQLLNSSEVKTMVSSEAQQIADRASASVPDSEGYRTAVVKSNRYVAFVNTTDRASIEAESENKVLSKAVIPHG